MTSPMPFADYRTMTAPMAEAVNPPEELSLSQWCTKYLHLSAEDSAEKGLWNTDRAPYQAGIMDALTDPAVEEVSAMTSSQVGKSTIGKGWTGYIVDRDPGPTLLINPTLDMARDWSRNRFTPMVRDSSQLKGRIRKARGREATNSVLFKQFPGGHLSFVGSNSPAALAARPIRYILGDEVDRFEPDAGGEGDPCDLAKKRTTTFWNRKLLWMSTPTWKGASRIEASYLESDQRKFFVPCPDCGVHQVLAWKQVLWDKDENGSHLPETAAYVCPHCGSVWSDARRWGAIAKGEWRATQPFQGRAGFWLNEIYSLWVPLERMARDFLAARRLPDRLRVFVNTSLGETFEADGKQADPHELYQRREDWGSLAPWQVVLITAAVDVQGDRLELEVVGWGRDEEVWTLARVVLPGDPHQPEVWADLDLLLLKSFRNQDGRSLPIRAVGVDTGDHTDAAYKFCRTRVHRKVFALKGIGGSGRPVWPPRFTRPKRLKAPLWAIGVDAAKETILERLKISEPGPGCFHFPMERDEEYFHQLTAERLVFEMDKRRGYKKVFWQKVRERNETLDLMVYNYAALQGLMALQRINLNAMADRLPPPPPGGWPKDGQPNKPQPAPSPSGGGSLLETGNDFVPVEDAW